MLELVIPHAELVASHHVVRALGVTSRRPWTVGGLVDASADWFVTRSRDSIVKSDHSEERGAKESILEYFNGRK